eukprot:1087398-Pyramimonas_sp.AAC.1
MGRRDRHGLGSHAHGEGAGQQPRRGRLPWEVKLRCGHACGAGCRPPPSPAAAREAAGTQGGGSPAVPEVRPSHPRDAPERGVE